MANPNPVLIKAYLKQLLRHLDEKKAAAKPEDRYSKTINDMFKNTKENNNG